MNASDTDPPSLAVAMRWVSLITTVSGMMVLPGLAGRWLDERMGTRLLAPLGFAFGFAAGLYYLIAAATQMNRTNRNSPRSPHDRRGPSASKDEKSAGTSDDWQAKS